MLEIFKKERGQSLTEVIIAFGVGVLMISTASAGVALILRSNEISEKNQVALAFNSGLAENLQSFAKGDWHNIHGLSGDHYFTVSAGNLVLNVGRETQDINGITYTRYFYIENVERDAGGEIGSGTDDPSTQKATVVTSYSIIDSMREIIESFYVTRWPNKVFHQTDWSGGSGQTNPVTEVNDQFYSSDNVNYSVAGSITPIPQELSYIYVIDTGNNRVQKFNSNGDFLTQWNGSEDPRGTPLNAPEGITVDEAQNIYVSDTGNKKFQKFDSNGGYITSWMESGCSAYGQGTFRPQDTTVDSSGYVYSTNAFKSEILKFDNVGECVPITWDPDNFSNPRGIGAYYDGEDFIYIADTGNNKIKKYRSDGSFAFTEWGGSGVGDGQFDGPYGIGIDQYGNIYVADKGNHRVQKFNSSGGFIGCLGGGILGWQNPCSSFTNGTANGQFENPEDVAVDEFDYVYVVDSVRNDIQKFNNSGVYQSQWGESGSGNGQFSSPRGITTAFTECTAESEACYLVSSIFDTGSVSGAGFNTLMWQGNRDFGSTIIKIAASDSPTGPWTYIDVTPIAPGIQYRIDDVVSDSQYIRYKVVLDSEVSNYPQVDDVIIGYSP